MCTGIPARGKIAFMGLRVNPVRYPAARSGKPFLFFLKIIIPALSQSEYLTVPSSWERRFFDLDAYGPCFGRERARPEALEARSRFFNPREGRDKRLESGLFAPGQSFGKSRPVPVPHYLGIAREAECYGAAKGRGAVYFNEACSEIFQAFQSNTSLFCVGGNAARDRLRERIGREYRYFDEGFFVEAHLPSRFRRRRQGRVRYLDEVIQNDGRTVLLAFRRVARFLLKTSAHFRFRGLECRRSDGRASSGKSAGHAPGRARKHIP